MGRGNGETLNDLIPSPLPQLHIVHYDSDSYDSLSEAAPKPQGLAVLGILIEVSVPPDPPRFLSNLSTPSSPILPMSIAAFPP